MLSKGLHLEQFKEPAVSSKILQINPTKIYIHASFKYSSHIFHFLKNAGEKVSKNEIIASKEATINSKKIINIYSHMDSIIEDTQYLLDETETVSSFIPIQSTNNLITSALNNDSVFNNQNIKTKTIDELIDIALKSSIIDETDGEYLFIKLINLMHKNVENRKIYIDAIDDQPYTSSKETIILNYPHAVNLACNIIKNAFNINNIEILFYDIENYNRNIKIPNKCIDTDITSVKGNYPIREISLNKKYKNYISIGIQALVHLSRSIINKDYKQTTTFLTIHGDAITSPKNVEIPIGTLVNDIIKNFDFNNEPKRVILGQIITGIALTDCNIAVSTTTRAICVLSDFTVNNPLECIGCSRCSNICPNGLLPCYNNKFKVTYNTNFESFSSSSKCIKCYCCTYICPSHIKLV